MADNDKPIEKRIEELARQVYAQHISGPGYVEVKVRGADASQVNLYVDGVCRYTLDAFDGKPLEALERYLQRELARRQAGRS